MKGICSCKSIPTYYGNPKQKFLDQLQPNLTQFVDNNLCFI